MKVILFGATGMVGQGVLRECLLDPAVESVLSIGRSASDAHHTKLREIVRKDLSNYGDITSELSGYDACFFCLGISSAGMSEQDYTRVTYGITVAAAGILAELNPRMTFVYISGAGTDSSEKGNIMWARVKGRTENAILKLPFAAAYMFRIGVVQPVNGETSRTKAYRVLYKLIRPLLPLLRSAFPKYVLTTEDVGKAMLAVVRRSWPIRVLESKDIRAVVQTAH